jgi:hypothetical protein
MRASTPISPLLSATTDDSGKATTSATTPSSGLPYNINNPLDSRHFVLKESLGKP